MNKKRKYVVIKEGVDCQSSTIFEPIELTDEEAEQYEEKLRYLSKIGLNYTDEYHLMCVDFTKPFDIDKQLPSTVCLVCWFPIYAATAYWKMESVPFYEFTPSIGTLSDTFNFLLRSHSKEMIEKQIETYANTTDKGLLMYDNFSSSFDIVLFNIPLDTSKDFDDFEEYCHKLMVNNGIWAITNILKNDDNLKEIIESDKEFQTEFTIVKGDIKLVKRRNHM